MTRHHHLWVGVTVGLTVAFLAGCTFTPSRPGSTTTTTVDFPYPPQRDILEIAVPVDSFESEAAHFALEVRRVRTFASYGGPEDVDRYNGMMAEQLKGSFHGLAAPQRTTGGETYRAVRAVTGADNAVQIDVCTYASPGVYGLQAGETRPHLIPNSDGYGVTRLTVEKTKTKSADGQIPAEPRWLAIDYDLALSFDMKETDRICAPFKPSPWVQKMPDPIESSTPSTK